MRRAQPGERHRESDAEPPGQQRPHHRNANWNHGGTNRIAIVTSVQYSGLPGSTVHPRTNSRKIPGSTRLRRRLSRIFQRDRNEIGLGTRRPASSGTRAEQPAHDLPVAAHPAMLAPVVGAVVRRIVVDDLDVAHQPGARVSALDQVVAEQRIAREAMLQHPAQGFDFVNALAGEDAFALQVLVNVGGGARVDVEAGLAGVDVGQPRLRRALHADADARLQNAVAGDDDVVARDRRWPGSADAPSRRPADAPCRAAVRCRCPASGRSARAAAATGRRP